MSISCHSKFHRADFSLSLRRAAAAPHQSHGLPVYHQGFLEGHELAFFAHLVVILIPWLSGISLVYGIISTVYVVIFTLPFLLV